jgi:glycosyltransferase involved in cell wall biosynthesis
MISLITATFNSEETIRDTLASVLMQSYVDYEYIVIDGASNDNTISIINSYKELFCGRLILVSEPDNGIYDAMNKGLLMAKGDIIGILNSDDFFARKDIFNIISNEFNKGIDCLYANLKIVERSNVSKVVRKYRPKFFTPLLLRFGIMPPHPTVYINRKMLDKIGLYNTKYKIVADFEFLLRIFLYASPKYKYLDDYILLMRDGGVSNMGIKSKFQITKEIKTACKANNIYTNSIMLNLRFFYKLTQYFTLKVK